MSRKRTGRQFPRSCLETLGLKGLWDMLMIFLIYWNCSEASYIEVRYPEERSGWEFLFDSHQGQLIVEPIK